MYLKYFLFSMCVFQYICSYIVNGQICIEIVVKLFGIDALHGKEILMENQMHQNVNFIDIFPAKQFFLHFVFPYFSGRELFKSNNMLKTKQIF